jgi:hypothetical protein
MVSAYRARQHRRRPRPHARDSTARNHSSASPDDFAGTLVVPASGCNVSAMRGPESWIGGHPIQGVTGVADMVGMLVAIAVGMLVAGAAVGTARRG